MSKKCAEGLHCALAVSAEDPPLMGKVQAQTAVAVWLG